MTVSDEMIERADGWLIVKRDLYFRPDCKGYTGIRDEAGRYSYEFAKGYEREGVSLVHESEAPEFREAAFDDLVIKHLIKQRDEARAALTAALEDGAVVVPAEVVRDLLLMPYVQERLRTLDRGIGTKTREAVWLRVRDAVTRHERDATTGGA